jgi:hypothetical protein
MVKKIVLNKKPEEKKSNKLDTLSARFEGYKELKKQPKKVEVKIHEKNGEPKKNQEKPKKVAKSTPKKGGRMTDENKKKFQENLNEDLENYFKCKTFVFKTIPRIQN